MCKAAVWNSEHIFFSVLLKVYKKYWQCSQASAQVILTQNIP